MVETAMAAGAGGCAAWEKEAGEGQGSKLRAERAGALVITGGGEGVDEIEARLFADQKNN